MKPMVGHRHTLVVPIRRAVVLEPNPARAEHADLARSGDRAALGRELR